MEKSATKRIARNFSWLMAGNILSGILLLIATIYAARVMGAAAFGAFSFAQAFLVYLVLTVDSGLSIFGTREIAQDRNRSSAIAANILTLRLVIAGAIFLISSGAVWLLPMPADLRYLFAVNFFFVFYRALNSDWIFQGLETMQYNAFAKIIFSCLVFVLTLGLVKSAADLVIYAGILSFSGIAVSCFFLYWLFCKILVFEPGSIKPAGWLKIFTLSLPLGASMIMVQIYNNLDTIMLGFMDRTEVVGHYNAAYKVFYVLVGVLALWQSTAVPAVSARIMGQAEKAAAFLQKYLRLTMLAVIPTVGLIALTAPQLVDLVFGVEYHAAGPVLRLLIFTFIPVAVGSTYGVLILIPAGRFYQFFWAVAFGALVNIILNFVLIPAYSMYGAASATIAAEGVAGAIAFYLSRDIIKVGLLDKVVKPIFISFLAAAGFLAVGSLLVGSDPIIAAFISSLAYIVLVVIAVAFVERGFIRQFYAEIFKAGSGGELAG